MLSFQNKKIETSDVKFSKRPYLSYHFEIDFDIFDDKYEVPMSKDVTEMGEIPYFIYTHISEKNILAYMIWHSWTCQLKNNNQNMQ